ncbi:MAG: hypothetical protein SYR96_14945 [Actinomycetota bacterium]|nr:hypothetical protein [Actinomycetota bacterium]
MIPTLDSKTGFLPVGRYPCTEAEIVAQFVDHEDFAGSLTRREIWDHWVATRSYLLDRIVAYKVWLGGSFVTAKLDPDDLDVVWTLDAEAAEALSSPQLAAVAPFISGAQGKEQHGLRIDSYAMFWRSYPLPGGADIEGDSYFRYRGYWDDFWMRARTGPKDAQPERGDSFPRRGYLEVTFREYA